MLHAVIMAGGSGTRFWPASRLADPKQLLNLAGERSMLQSTVDRLGPVVPAQRLLILTNERLCEAIRRQLPDVPADSIVGEPCRRDTAGAIGLAAVLLAARDPQATMVVLPSDHVISPDAGFQQAISDAAKLVDARPGCIVTFGIKPTYPAESFGYIERAGPVSDNSAPSNTYRVEQFREKPQADVAREYLESGKFYWNSGIFVWRAQTILDALREFRPKVHEPLEKIAAAVGQNNFQEVFAREFAALESVSIDFAVMEHHRDVLVTEASYDWDDLGSWRALARLRGTDADKNTIVGRHVGVRTSGSIIRSSGEHLVATLGVKDLIVVHTPDATLVAHKEDEEAIRQIVDLLKEQGLDAYL